MSASDENRSPHEAECRRLTEALALAQRDAQLLGFEIHDGIVQDLSAATMLLEGVKAELSSPEAKDRFERAVRLLQQTIAAARHLVEDSSTAGHVRPGIVDKLVQLVRKFREEYALPVTFVRAVADDFRLPASVEQLLLRIAQESLHNARKHSRATEVEVHLGTNDGNLELVIADNGKGFDPSLVPAGHYGLESIRARARVLHADLLIDTAPQHGTRIVVRLPPSIIV